MGKTVDKLISYSFGFLILLVPLVFSPTTSEIFEFNKVVVTYIFTAIIVFLWVSKMIFEGKIVFRRTILDIPILLFLISQFISTLLSLDFRTSFLGYYSRFHGGFVSYLCYSLLYWALVSNLNRKLIKIPLIFLLIVTFITSVWGIFEHFGHSLSCLLVPQFHTFDVSCWIQDVQTRVYATFGQPNWMAAFLVAVVPITWAISISNLKSKYFWISQALSAVFFVAVLYTRSRSGLLALASADFIFWLLSLLLVIKTKLKLVNILKTFSIIHISFLILIVLNGSPWTPPIKNLLMNQNTTSQIQTPPSNKVAGPALEVGGSESGKIRNIVWKGAIDVWKNFPIFGSGVETFAYSYYMYRLPEHNLVSEWDYLYNKAHNEYLNFAATTGTIGIVTYLILIIFMSLTFVKFPLSNFQFPIKNKKIKSEDNNFLSFSIYHFALLSGFISILVSNFFGFSVVPVTLLFFLYPATSAVLITNESEETSAREIKTTIGRKISIGALLLLTSYFLLLISRYWHADNLYAKGEMNNDAGNYSIARSYLVKAIKVSPNESVFWDSLAKSTAYIALLANKEEKSDLVKELLNNFDFESQKALSLSPANVNIKRNQAALYIQLSSILPQYLLTARNLLEDAVRLAPTEAKLLYNLSIAYYRTNDIDKAVEIMEKTVAYKANYKDAYFALSLMYIDKGEKEKAKEKLEYILKYISPDDTQTKRQLEEIK